MSSDDAVPDVFAAPPDGVEGRPNPREATTSGWRLTLGLVRRLPQGALSRWTGWLAERRIPRPLRAPVIGSFARAAGIDLSEAGGAPRDFPSISAFFSRPLRPGVRQWPRDPALPTSPVDGIVGALGDFREGRLIQAKGLRYTVEELLASADEAQRFREGFFITVYLSPRHYHRIHAPVGGGLRAARVVPGALLPVNVAAVTTLPGLFPRNERLIAHLSVGEGPGREHGEPAEEAGEVAVVAVGAFNVGRISAAFDRSWNGPRGRGVTNRRGRDEIEARVYRPPLALERGDEMMSFHLGSTVVLLFDPIAISGLEPHPALVPGTEVRLGAPLFCS